MIRPRSIIGSCCNTANRTTADGVLPSLRAALRSRPRKALSMRIGIGFVRGGLVICKNVYYRYTIRVNKKDWWKKHQWYTMPQAVKTKPIPVRFSPEVLERLSAVAQRIGTDRSSVVRMITRRFLDQYDGDPSAFVGIDFPSLLHHSDGRRTARYPAASTPVIALNEPSLTHPDPAHSAQTIANHVAAQIAQRPARTRAAGAQSGKAAAPKAPSGKG